MGDREPLTEIRKVTVLGTGTMGNGIALWFARAGLEVRMRDLDANLLDRARTMQSDTLKALVAVGGVSQEEEEAILGRIHGTTEMAEALEGTDFILEAVPEVLDLKQNVFGEIEKLAPPGVPLGFQYFGNQHLPNCRGGSRALPRGGDALVEPSPRGSGHRDRSG